jgi:hypothetical protein
MTLAPVSGLWRAAWRTRGFRARVLVTLPALAIVLFVLSRFLLFVELRHGSILADPVLRLVPPHDVTWLTFGFIYAGLVGGLMVLARHPERCVLAFQTYVIMAVFRIVAMVLMPLDPPATMLALKDPFVEFFGTGTTLTRDLFFSGHTSTLFLLYLVMPSKITRALFLVCVAGVAACVIIQHVHYAIDVFAAPFFAYGALVVARAENARFFPIVPG